MTDATNTTGDERVVDWARRQAHAALRQLVREEGRADERFALNVLAEEVLRFGTDGHPAFHCALLNVAAATRRMVLDLDPLSPEVDRSLGSMVTSEATALRELRSAGLSGDIYYAIADHIMGLFLANEDEWRHIEESGNA